MNDDLARRLHEAEATPTASSHVSNESIDSQETKAGWTFHPSNKNTAHQTTASLSVKKKRQRKILGLGIGGLGALMITSFLLPASVFGVVANAVNSNGFAMFASFSEHRNELVSIKLRGNSICSGPKCIFQEFNAKEIKSLDNIGAKMYSGGAEVKFSDDISKVAVDTIELDGIRLTAGDYAVKLADNPKIAAQMDNVFNPKFESVSGKAWRKVKSKFRITKAKNVSGETVEEVIKSMDGIVEKSLPKVSGLTDDAAKEVQKAADELNPSVAGKVGQEVYDVLSLSGGVPNYFCGIYNGARAANLGKKLVQRAWMIPMAFAIMNTISLIQAGDAKMQDAEALGGVLTASDSNGKGFMNSYGASYKLYGDAGPLTESASMFSFGGNGPFVGLTAGIVALFASIGLPNPKTACNVVRNPLVQLADAAAGGLLAYFSGGFSSIAGGSITKASAMAMLKNIIRNGAKNIIKSPVFWASLAFEAAVVLIPVYLQEILAGKIPSKMTSEQRGDSFWSASESLFNEGFAKQNGNAPLTVEQHLAVQKQITSYEQQLAAQDRATKSPFDTSSQYTFMGALFHQFIPRFASTTTYSFVANIGSILQNGLLSPFKSASAANTTAKYEVCDDDDYNELGLAISPFCNVLYGLPDFKSFDETYNFMTTNNYLSASLQPQGDYQNFITNCIDRSNPLGYAPDGELDNGSQCLLNNYNTYFYNWYQYDLVK